MTTVLDDHSAIFAHHDPLVLPPMLVSTCILGLVGVAALCVSKPPSSKTLLRAAVMLRRTYLCTTEHVYSICSVLRRMCPIFANQYFEQSKPVDGCRFTKAVVCEGRCERFDGRLRDFASVTRCVYQNKQKIRMWYTLEDGEGEQGKGSRQYIVTYDPLAVTHIRCPPHMPRWGVRGAHPDILTASLTVVHSGGECRTYDVSSDLRHHYGPNGDFHRRAGGVLTALDIMPGLEDDVCDASIIYYDEIGTEHTITLPYPSTRESSESVEDVSMSLTAQQRNESHLSPDSCHSDECDQLQSCTGDSKQAGLDGLALRIPGDPTDGPIVLQNREAGD